MSTFFVVESEERVRSSSHHYIFLFINLHNFTYLRTMQYLFYLLTHVIELELGGEAASIVGGEGGLVSSRWQATKWLVGDISPILPESAHRMIFRHRSIFRGLYLSCFAR